LPFVYEGVVIHVVVAFVRATPQPAGRRWRYQRVVQITRSPGKGAILLFIAAGGAKFTKLSYEGCKVKLIDLIMETD